MSDWKNKDDAYWKEKLTPEQYEVCRKKGTEAPFSGEYNVCKVDGDYQCLCCGQTLFHSNTKYDSGSGWPSFYEVAVEGAIDYHEDRSLDRVRTEVTCSRCGSHLGHVFDDGPKPTGKRYCINSVAIQLKQDPKGS